MLRTTILRALPAAAITVLVLAALSSRRVANADGQAPEALPAGVLVQTVHHGAKEIQHHGATLVASVDELIDLADGSRSFEATIALPEAADQEPSRVMTTRMTLSGEALGELDVALRRMLDARSALAQSANPVDLVYRQNALVVELTSAGGQLDESIRYRTVSRRGTPGPRVGWGVTIEHLHEAVRSALDRIAVMP